MVCKGDLWLCQHHFGQPPRILLDLLQMGFFSLPGSTWLLTHCFPSCHQQGFHLAFSPDCPGPDSWHFFRSWLWLPLLSLYGWTAESRYVSLETTLQLWLIVGSWPPARAQRKVEADSVISGDSSVFQHHSQASNNHLILTTTTRETRIADAFLQPQCARDMLNTYLDNLLSCFSRFSHSPVRCLEPGVVSYAGCRCNLMELMVSCGF